MIKQQIQILDLTSDDIGKYGEEKFVITIYGKTKDNKNVVLNVIEFRPFILCKDTKELEYKYSKNVLWKNWKS